MMQPMRLVTDDAVHPWADEFSNIYRADDVTHWQPLPEPPK